MSAIAITLSSKGQVVIPKEVREELNWQPGMQLCLLSGPSGVTIRALPKKGGRNLSELVGMLKHEGPPLSTEALCRPVDVVEDEAESGTLRP